MDSAMLARLGAAALVVLAIAVAVFGPGDDAPAPRAERFGDPVDEMPRDPMRRELLRCQALGQAGPRDADCLKTWAQSRGRFLKGRDAAAPEAP